ncbi:MAG: tetratricopeptide repeat protein [Tenacibaculum sp.]|uniref:tetratricopeptide repeat protein n=1 Tax=Tenacibaculum sp. TaxID=1906242 RepID=UPI0018120119|nr:tetratricopeptide repeat protein [Tenacibaculum sp.]NVK08635.1 tetratricopeptide repeat protein [Tenacibaculum sp.]
MKMHKSFYFFTVYLFFCVNFSLAQNQEKYNIENYKKLIVDNYYLFQKTEDPRLLDKTLRFIKLNKFVVTEDTIHSKIYYLKGVNNLFLKRYNKAEYFFLKSFELAQKSNDYLLMGTIYNSRGVTLVMGEKKYAKAEELYKKAIVYYKKINELTQQIDSYYNLTKNSAARKKWKNSIEYAEKCIELIHEEKHRTDGLKRLYIFIADGYLELKQYEKVIENLKIAEKYISPTDSYENSLLNKVYAKYYESQKNYLEALKSYKKVSANLEENNTKKEEELKNSFVRELELENKLVNDRDATIKSKNKLLILSVTTIILLIVFSRLTVSFAKKNKSKKNEILKLNSNLKSLIDSLKEKNKDLDNKKIEIENLLSLNEQTLFSKVLKISTYTDSIRKISEDIESYTNNNPKASSYLIKIGNKLNSLISEDELWEDFKIQFEKIRPDFFNKLKEVAPNLSVNDLKHCTYIISNLKSKEVAQLINVSPRSVETARYRIKKKVGLAKDESLYNYLSNL